MSKPQQPDATIEADDFIQEADRNVDPTLDEGRVPVLEANGKISNDFINTKFGGDGSDGELAITSGTTTIDCLNEKIVVLNYTELSITGSAKLAFSNPHTNGTVVVIKVQNDVTLTSSETPMIDMSGMGAHGGDAGANRGGEGEIPFSFNPFLSFEASTASNFTGGSGGGSSVKANASDPTNASGGKTNYGANVVPTDFNLSNLYSQLYPFATTGGGGAGSTRDGGSAVAAPGGDGGGCLIIECGGAFNFTTTNGISVAGLDGEDSTPNSDFVTNSGGGGAGYFLGIYTTLTANTGSVNIDGGDPGTGGNWGNGTAGADGFAGFEKQL